MNDFMKEQWTGNNLSFGNEIRSICHFRSIVKIVKMVACADKKERNIKIVQLYYANNKSTIKTLREYNRSLKAKDKLNKRHVYRIIDNFCEGYVREDKPRSGRPKTARTPRNIERIKKRLEESPRRSTARLSAETGITKASVRRILKEDLNYFPYKIQITQELTPSNKKKRLDFALDVSARMERK